MPDHNKPVRRLTIRTIAEWKSGSVDGEINRSIWDYTYPMFGTISSLIVGQLLYLI